MMCGKAYQQASHEEPRATTIIDPRRGVAFTARASLDRCAVPNTDSAGRLPRSRQNNRWVHRVAFIRITPCSIWYTILSIVVVVSFGVPRVVERVRTSMAID